MNGLCSQTAIKAFITSRTKKSINPDLLFRKCNMSATNVCLIVFKLVLSLVAWRMSFLEQPQVIKLIQRADR